MLSRSIIVVGDVNSSNGPVISGSATDTIDGKPIARKGDLVAVSYTHLTLPTNREV